MTRTFKRTVIRPWLALAALSLVACFGGGDEGGNQNQVVQPGDEELKPDPVDDGTGKKPGSTDTTCELAEDCGYWYCECSDGAVVNTANCTNGYCLGAASTCPEACEYFDHGGWTGSFGGGPGDPLDPPENECGEQGSTSDVCWSCVQSECCSESAACYDNPDCLDYWDCRSACGIEDPECTQTCADLYPFGVSDFEIFGECLVGFCGAEC